jgi:hypothetical protein
MADALVFDVPVELGLEFVPIVCSHFPDAEREALDDLVDEQDGIGGLGVPVVDLESHDAGGIVDGGVLIALDRLPVFSSEDQKLDVDLDLMAWNLLLVTSGVNLAKPCSPRQPVQAIALEDTGYAGSGDLDVMVAGQIPDDVHRPQMVCLPQVKNLLDDFRRCSVLWVLWDWLLPNEARLTIILKCRLPSVESGPANAEVPAGPANMPGLLGMPQDPQPALNLAIFLGH